MQIPKLSVLKALKGNLSLHGDKLSGQKVKVVASPVKAAVPQPIAAKDRIHSLSPLVKEVEPLVKEAALQGIERLQQQFADSELGRKHPADIAGHLERLEQQLADSELGRKHLADIAGHLARLVQLLADKNRIRANAKENNSKKPHGDKPRCEPSAGEGSNLPPASPTPVQIPVPNNRGVGTDHEIGPTQWMKLAIVLMGAVIAIVSIFSTIHLAMNGEGTTANIIAVVGILGGFAWGACCVWFFWGRKS